MLTRKDFKSLCNVIRDILKEAKNLNLTAEQEANLKGITIRHICNFCREQNERFDIIKFIAYINELLKT